MDKILIDTNVLLDIILERQPFFDHSSALLQLAPQKGISLYITATTITDLYYIIRKAKGHSLAISFITEMVAFLDVAGVDKAIILAALESGLDDFEDAVQAKAAEKSDINVIVTRNAKDFDAVGLLVYTPEEILNDLLAR